MCGVIAAMGLNHLPENRWSSALEVLASRGPDATNITRMDDVTFGHSRLSIIGLGSEGNQPVRRSKSLLAYNGEIYNYRQIAGSINLNAESDTQVLSALFEMGIEARISDLRGMYAAVHYDANHGVVTAIRDPFGIKPLYWRNHPNGAVSIASTPAALITLAGDAQPDPQALTYFLATGFIPEGFSAFAGIHKVPSGSILSWYREGDRWRMQEPKTILPGAWPLSSVEDALRNSVKAHLVADVDVGILLSGGIDSTLIAALATEQSNSLKTFSLTNPDNPNLDESSYASHNAALLGTQHFEIPVTPKDLAPQVGLLIQSSGEPFGDPAFLALSKLTKVVSGNVKVALAGEGADELFGGYRRYDIERSLDKPSLDFVAMVISLFPGLKNLSELTASRVGRLFSALINMNPRDRHSALMFANWSTVLQGFDESGKEAFKFSADSWERLKDDPWALGFPSNRAYDLRTWLPNVFLEKSDRASMAHGLELRTPFLDPEVAAAASFFKPMNSFKDPLRSTLLKLLPGVALPTSKKGLSVDTREICESHYQDVISEVLESPHSVLREIGMTNINPLKKAAKKSPAFAFRLATLGVWSRIWLK